MSERPGELRSRWSCDSTWKEKGPILSRLKSAKDLVELDLRGIVIGEEDLLNLNLQDRAIREVDFSFSTLNCSFIRSQIVRSIFRNARFNDASFRKSHVETCDFTKSRFEASDLSDWECIESTFTDAVLKDRRQLPMQLLRSKLIRCDFSGAVFKNVELRAARFTDCIFTGTVFEGCDLRGVEFAGGSPSTELLKGCYL